MVVHAIEAQSISGFSDGASLTQALPLLMIELGDYFRLKYRHNLVYRIYSCRLVNTSAPSHLYHDTIVTAAKKRNFPREREKF